MPFTKNANIIDNAKLRVPQREAWIELRRHFSGAGAGREVGIVLPVGCGKSGVIAIAPFALSARRVLVIAPGLRIRGQLASDLKASSASNFYERCAVISDPNDFPDAAIIESGRVNVDDLQYSDFAVTNIHQVAGEDNRWLSQLPADFFDAILVDEAHHNPALSWQQVTQRFPDARIVNFSATPLRADGRVMAGEVIYSFPVIRAIQAGYVKRLRAKMLRPSTLRYVDTAGGIERLIGPDEVRELGETDPEFRRGIVMSPESLASIVDCAIGELHRLRRETGEKRLKIIASALNQAHCIQITEALRARGLRADYVHSRETGAANERVFSQLENHELDAIVQARMLGEGFDHRYLSVAMVASVFANLSPFVQFVGRVMRAIEQSAPGHPLNQGVVVFHVGANVARRWSDFRTFSEADQAYFADLLPEVEDVNAGGEEIIDREPGDGGRLTPVEVLEQGQVLTTDMHPIGDPVTAGLLRQLAETGVTPDQAAQELRRLRADRQDIREARRASLNDRVQNEVGRILAQLKVNPRGKTLDRARRQNNFAWLAAELNRRLNDRVGGSISDRQNFPLERVNEAHDALADLSAALEAELKHAAP